MRLFCRTRDPVMAAAWGIDYDGDASEGATLARPKWSKSLAQPASTTGAPKKILLATDLSCRCDRALDRAAQLAHHWNARLLVLHVLKPKAPLLEEDPFDRLPTWRRPLDRAAVMEAQIRRDLLQDLPAVAVRVEEGEPAPTIDAVARAEGCDLIVTGVARDETFGRYLLGTTVDALVRHSAVPVLIVRRRLKPYDEIVVATDFSDSARHALNTAARFFPRSALTLFHAFEIPFAGFLNRRDFHNEFRSVEQEACQKFLEESDLTEEQRGRVKVLVEHGAPEKMIQAYMEDKNVQLVVLGTHGRSALFDVLIGSTAKRILKAAPGDVLLVRDPRAAGGANDPAGHGQQVNLRPRQSRAKLR
jgi:nucleotide-binding universal stress UspA family protein